MQWGKGRTDTGSRFGERVGDQHGTPRLLGVGPVAMLAVAVPLAAGSPALADHPRGPTAQIAQAGSPAQAAQPFDIPAGDLTAALSAFSQRVTLQLLYPADVTIGRRTQGVRGTFTPRQALDRLIAGTGLEARATNADTVTLVPVPAAPPDAGGPLRLDPLLVTGERVARTVFDTAASVAVITGEDLARRPGDVTLNDAIEAIPNVIDGGPSFGPFIRGQATLGPLIGGGAFFAGTVPRSSAIVDGRVTGFNEFAYGIGGIWDVDRIEVFRGPQTTAQGANSIAGAIYVETNDPTFEPEMAVQAQIGTLTSYRAAGMVSGPLIDDTLAARATFEFSARETFVSYTNPDFELGDADADDALINGRVKLLWLPEAIDRLSTTLTLNHVSTNGPQTRQVTDPIDDLDNSLAGSQASFRTRVSAAILDTTYDLADGITVTNQLQYSDIETIRDLFPVDGGSASINGDDLANEARVNFSVADGRLSGVAGVYFRRQTAEEALRFFGSTTFDDEKNSLGLFSEVTGRLTDRLSLTGGLRYQRDTQQRVGTSALIPGTRLDFDGTFDAILPKASIAYDVTEDVTVGALVTRGYNPGGVGLSFAFRDFIEFDEETLWNYEAFTRAQLLDGRLTLLANAFYTDIENAQRLQRALVPGADIVDTFVVTAEEARTFGLEVSADLQVTDRARVFAGLGLLQTEFQAFGAAAADLSGNDFRLSPSYTVSAGFDWEVLEGLTVGSAIRHVDGYFSDDLNSRGLEVDPYTVVDVSLAYEPVESVRVFAYLNNAFDSIHATDRLAGAGGTLVTVEDPREFGIGLQLRF